MNDFVFTPIEVIRSYEKTDLARVRDESAESLIVKYQNTDAPSLDIDAGLRYEHDVLSLFCSDLIIKSHGIKWHNNRHILILEGFKAVTLTRLIANNALSFLQRLQIACQLSGALSEVHQHKIIHRDITPDNILVDRVNYQIKLCDFSLSTRLDSQQSLIKNIHLWHSLDYISPELTGRTNIDVDYRCDFYSLGATLFELFTGKKPFKTEQTIELLHAHIALLPKTPYKINDKIPRVLSNIILKLMAKSPDQRYQSHYGLQQDLNNCLVQWQLNESITNFAIAQTDSSEKFCIQQKLYGREWEISEVMAAFERTYTNTAELLLVSGYSGIGKSALVNELHKPIVKKNGYFVSGKCDQFNRNQPYTALIQAFQTLLQQLVSNTEGQLPYWKKRLTDALGNNTAIIAEIVPEIINVVGDVAAITELPPIESENRFHRAFSQFVSALSSSEHPLVLFLDDLQWADIPSLKLVEQQITNGENKALLIVGAYRDNEVDQYHPLSATLDNIKKQRGRLNNLKLTNLQPVYVEKLITDTLHCSPQHAASLVELCIAKTQGNPFFLNQFLLSLYDIGCLYYQYNTGQWQWNIEDISRQGITDNVVDLMISKLRRLTAEAQQVLSLAAHLGNHFNMQQLSTIAAQQTDKIAGIIWPALQTGLILPLDEDYKYNQMPEKLATASYRFLHDRVQHAAYRITDEEQRPTLHLKIGRALLADRRQDSTGNEIFATLELYNKALTLVTNDDEKSMLLDLNLQAGITAKRSSAHHASVNCLRIAKQLLPSEAWQQNPDRTLAVYKELAESEIMAGNFVAASLLHAEGISAATTVHSKISLLMIEAKQHQIEGKMAASVEVLIRCLSLLGVNIAETEAEASSALPAIYTDTQQLLKRRGTPDALRALPEIRDPDKLLEIQIYDELSHPLYLDLRLAMYSIVACHMVQLSIKHGQSDMLSKSFMCYTFAMEVMKENQTDCYRISKLSTQLAEQRGNPYYLSSAYLGFGGFNQHWCEPLRNTYPYLDKVINGGFEGVNLGYTGYAMSLKGLFYLVTGESLAKIEAEILQYLAFLRQTHQPMAISRLMLGVYQPLLALQGKTLSPTSFDSDDYAVDDVFKGDYDSPSLLLVFLHSGLMRQCYLMDDAAGQIKHRLAIERIPAWLANQAYVIESRFFAALSLLGSSNVSAEALAKATEYANYFEYIASHKSTNYHHRYLLITAEIARVNQQADVAMSYYEKAIEATNKAGITHCQALANELYAKFMAARNYHHIASKLIQEAHLWYRHWGAVAKCELIEKTWHGLTFFESQDNSPQLVVDFNSPANNSESIDLNSLMKANNVLAEEVLLDGLLRKLIAILLENAGAQQGGIIANYDDELTAEIYGKFNASRVEYQLLNNATSDGHQDQQLLFSKTLLNYVKSTKKTLRLNNPVDDQRFSQSNYLQTMQPKSILCLPIVGRGKLVAIVYLENNLLENAFTAQHQKVLELIASQAAVSLINTRLYADLEEKVRVRTEQLEKLSIEDGLTGIANRRRFDQMYSHEWHRCLRTGASITLLMIDIDCFKLYNDNYGHQQGDICIKLIAQTLKKSATRSTDLVARYGGEEFIIMLPEASAEMAEKVAQRCLDAVRDLNIVHEHSLVREIVSISIGAYKGPIVENMKAESLIIEADKALYKAKRQGRDRFVSAN